MTKRNNKSPSILNGDVIISQDGLREKPLITVETEPGKKRDYQSQLFTLTLLVSIALRTKYTQKRTPHWRIQKT